jgi:hypothetical protein
MQNMQIEIGKEMEKCKEREGRERQVLYKNT